MARGFGQQALDELEAKGGRRPNEVRIVVGGERAAAAGEGIPDFIGGDALERTTAQGHCRRH